MLPARHRADKYDIQKKMDGAHDAIMLRLAHDTLGVIRWGRIQALLVQDRAELPALETKG